MTKFTIGLSLSLFFSLAGNAGSALHPIKIVPDQFLTTWLILGPIPLQLQPDMDKSWEHLPGYRNNYLQKWGGEAKLKVRSGDKTTIGGKILIWKLVESKDPVVDLVIALSDACPVFAFAYAEVEAAEAGVQLLGLGTNDGATLFVNGVQVFDYPGMRSVKTDGDLVPVLLKKGKNTLLLKVEQHLNKWGFCLRFKKFSASEAIERGDLLRVWADESGVAKLVSSYRPEVLQTLIQTVEVSVQDPHGRLVTTEERSIPLLGEVDIPSADYRPYRADLKIHLKNGEILRSSNDFTAGRRIGYALFSKGKSDYIITLANDASESEQWAAKELQHWLKEISTTELPIVAFSSNYKGHQIFIGHPTFPGISMVPNDNSPTSQESFHYYNIGPDIFITGGKQRGTMYGVLTFLERELGCRWYSATVNVIPKRSELTFEYLDHAERPGIQVRNDFYFDAFDPIWATRNKMNGAMGTRKQPGGSEGYWGVHTLYPMVPAAEFFGKHPEYYSMLGGKRVGQNAQLCLSNPDVLKIVTERIKETMRKFPDNLIYDVSQNDFDNPCQCDKCQALSREYGGESGVVVWFVNQVAAAVEKEFPDKLIGTLAYRYTTTPPKNIRPMQNVVIRFCSGECCFSHPFRSFPDNKKFMSDLEGWSGLAPHLYIWDYVVSFLHYLAPFPNIKILHANIQTLRDNHAIGIMEQAAYQSRGGEFAELRSYLIAKLLWNPDINSEEVINDFIYGYYGHAGRFVRQYFDLLYGLVTPDTHIHPDLTPDNPIFTETFIRESNEIFLSALKLANDDEILRRVELCYLPILYLKSRRMPELAKRDGSYELFCRITSRENVTHYSEAGEVERKAFHNMVENAK